MTTMLQRLRNSDPEPKLGGELGADEAALVETLNETALVLDRLLGETVGPLEAYLYQPTIPLERLTGATVVTLIADAAVLREALRRVRAIRRAILDDGEDRARFSAAGHRAGFAAA